MNKQSLQQYIPLFGLLVIVFGVFGLVSIVWGLPAPLHPGPFQDVDNSKTYTTGDVRGQYKTGKLTIGGASVTSSTNLFLEVIGNLKITPQPPSASGGLSSGYGAFPALQVLGSGYIHDVIVLGGDPSLVGVLPTPSPMPALVPDTNTAIDIRGGIQLDPTIANLDWANTGQFYVDPISGTVSTTEKPLCGNATGDIILCP